MCQIQTPMFESSGTRKFRRVLVKRSGEALREPGSTDNSSPPIVEDIAAQIKAAHQTGLEIAEIKEINRRLADEGIAFRLLTGVEVDILIACQLDLPDDVLAELDVVVASIHQGFNQGEAENTKRLIGAAENRFVHMLGHMTGRLLLERDSYKVNQHAVIDACAETGTWIELNASPYRLDMDWRLWKYARSKGVKCVINCDAHRNEHAMFLRLGAMVARKGWLTKAEVMNTLPLPLLMEALQKKRLALAAG